MVETQDVVVAARVVVGSCWCSVRWFFLALAPSTSATAVAAMATSTGGAPSRSIRSTRSRSHGDGHTRCMFCDRFEDMELTLEQSEAHRTQLLTTVGQLQDQVAKLQAAQQNSNIVVARLEDRMTDTLEALRDQFDTAMTVQTPRRRGKEPIGNQVMKTKELATQNAREISDLFEQLSAKSESVNRLESTVSDLQDKLRNVQAMAENITRKTIENLQKSQLQVHEDLVALQQLVARKVDRRDMTLLSSALERLDSFAKLEQQLRHDYDSLVAANNARLEEINEQRDRLLKTNGQVSSLNSTVQRLPKRAEIIALQKSLKDMVDTGLRTLLKRVNLLSSQSTNLAKDNAIRIEELARGADAVGSRFATFEQDLQQALDGKVSVGDMDKYIDQIQNEVLIVNAQRSADIDQVCERINADAKKNTNSLSA